MSIPTRGARRRSAARRQRSLPRSAILTLLLAALATSTASTEAQPVSFSAPALEPPAVERLAALDAAALLAEDAAAEPYAGPLRFAEALAVELGLAAGEWSSLADGSRLWRLRLESPGALSLNLGLDRFELPEGARLWLYDADRRVVQGPYERADRAPGGGLWTALVPGEAAILELHLPAGAELDEVGLEIAAVNRGYRPLGLEAETGAAGVTVRDKQGSCNNDVVCPEGDGWRDEIRSVAWYTVDGVGLCTGTLMNNTAGDFRPYFLTAEHCSVTPTNAGTMVVYWNYESPVCGQLSGGRLTDSQSGALWRAADDRSDFTLVELLAPPPAAYGVYYAGWDARGVPPSGVVGIHHPNLDEKAISFDHDPLLVDDADYWRVGQWEDGTTEPGSSGSCIFDRDSKLCVGTLTGGQASCTFTSGFDVYGRMDAHWEGANGSSRLRDWLDPTGSGARTLAGADPLGTPPPEPECIASETVACLNEGRFAVSITWRNQQGETGVGKVVPGGSDDSVLFWFFRAANWEILVKVLDGCPVNGRYWVLGAAATNVEYTLSVTDTESGSRKDYVNPLGRRAPAIADTSFFEVCP